MAIESFASTLRLAPRRSLRSMLFLPSVDVAALTAAFWLGGLINFSYRNWGLDRSVILLLLTLACITAFHHLGHYSRRRPFWQEVGDVLIVAALALVADAAMLYLLKVNFSRAWVLSSWGLVAVALPFVRTGAKHVSSRLGNWRQPTVIVGTGPNAIEAAMAFAYDFAAGAGQPSGLRDRRLHRHLGPQRRAGQPVLRRQGSAGRDHRCRGQGPAGLARPAACRGGPRARGDGAARGLHREPVAALRRHRHRHALRGLPINRARITHFFSQDMLSLRIYNNLARPWSQALKRGFDIVVGGLLLLLAAPLLAVIAWQVHKSGGAALFGHERVGRHGQLFKCWKFRTMVPDADKALARLLAESPEARAEWERDFKLKSDPRVTPIGRWLRQTSFDELPQLFNVIKGEMSLIGPRPVVRDELRRYGELLVYYTQVRPGLTGLWQISGRNDVDYARRIHLDAWYVRNWNLWYDIVILTKTFTAVLTRSGAY